MCGIVGILDLAGGPVASDLLGRMTTLLAHRGPDGEGIHLGGAVGLGHRRLAVIDLTSDSDQPMQDDDGRLTLVYNGEIYNFAELRTELEGLGRVFRSRGDTEVLLQAWDQWGPEALPRLNGMFAFALWDAPRRELFLARDRYGVKPLYWTVAGGQFLFASEQKAILAHPAAARRLDPEALVEYLTFQNIFTDRTLIAGVRTFPAGSWARVRPGGDGSFQPLRRWWDFHFAEPERPEEPAAYAEEIGRLVRQAVHRQLVSDVPLGSYLSGGMDSGSLTAVAATALPYVKTFTCGFDLHSASGLELAADEREAAEHLSYLFRTEHYEMVLKAGDMERILPRLAWHLEEPRVGQSYPNFYVAQLASRFVTVVLSGTGGDELFAGYPWRYCRFLGPEETSAFADRHYAAWQRLLPGEDLALVTAPLRGETAGVSTREIFRGVYRGAPPRVERPEEAINLSLDFEARTFLHGLLVVEDKLSMAHGLETRVPFLDNDLVDFAQRVPAGLKLRNLGAAPLQNENEPGPKTALYYRRTRDGKLVLREAMAGLVPPEIAQGPKQGFSAPDASWFKGESIDYVRRIVHDDRAVIYDYLDPRAVRRLVADHLEGRHNRRLLIWSLLNLEWWARQYLGRGGDYPGGAA
jgi:asparagine synthase (glutamine-hydrolysing)